MVDPSKNSKASGRWKARLLALAIAGVLGALAGEGVVRASRGTPLVERLPVAVVRANSHRGWEMLPGMDHYTYQHLVHVNSLGLRGTELADPKGARERRVLALGDSMVYGQGVADDQTLPYHLESILDAQAASGEEWTVINGGHRGYSTNQELGLLEELGPSLQLDAVVLFWYSNDIFERSIAEMDEELRERGEVSFDIGAPMEGRAKLKWQVTQFLRRSALVMFLHDELRQVRHHEPIPASLDGAFERQAKSLSRMASLCEAQGWDLYFAVIPDIGTLKGSPRSLELVRRVTELARGEDFQIIDLLPALRGFHERSDERLVLPYDGHYVGASNRVLAQPVAEALLSQAPSMRPSSGTAGTADSRSGL